MSQYGGLKNKCILRLAKAKLKMEKKMTLPILPALLCCSVSKEHKAQLTTKKKEWRERTKKKMHFHFLGWISSKHCKCLEKKGNAGFGCPFQLLSFLSLQFEREEEHNFIVATLPIPSLTTVAMESGLWDEILDDVRHFVGGVDEGVAQRFLLLEADEFDRLGIPAPFLQGHVVQLLAQVVRDYPVVLSEDVGSCIYIGWFGEEMDCQASQG